MIADLMRWEEGVDVIQVMMARGADVDARDSEGNTPLHLAIWSGVWFTAIALLNAGADVDAPNQDGDTPLHLAASRKWHSAQKVVALLDAKADALRKNAKGQTPFDIATDNETLTDSDAYQRLRNAHFDAPPVAP